MFPCVITSTLLQVQSQAWGDVLLNRILVVVSIFLLLACLRNFLFLLPHLAYCLGRARGNVSLQHSISTARIRNILAAANLIPFCLLADRFAFYRPAFWNLIPSGWSVPATIGIATAFLLLRGILYLTLKPRKVNSEVYDAARCTLYNYLIIHMVISMALFMMLYAFRVPSNAIRSILLHLLGVVYLAGTVRCAQIFSSVFSGIRTFLYLCALEFIPLASLIASAIVF